MEQLIGEVKLFLKQFYGFEKGAIQTLKKIRRTILLEIVNMNTMICTLKITFKTGSFIKYLNKKPVPSKYVAQTNVLL